MGAKPILTSVQPLRLFGQTVPGLAQAMSGGYTLAIVRPEGGGKFKTTDGKLSPADRARVAARLKRQG